MYKPKAIVIGAGITGLAMARALGIKGYRVTVIERTTTAVGASVRNFGMIWPIGQPSGDLFDASMRSREVWKEFGSDSGVFCEEAGSFHLSYHHDENAVLQDLFDIYGKERNLSLLSPQEVLAKSPAVVTNGLQKGLFSPNELIVDPRESIKALPTYLETKFGVEFLWGKMVLEVDGQTVYTSTEQFDADLVMICSGTDLELLFPKVYNQLPITRCKLQMLRMGPQEGNWRIGPALCGGLSLIHYNSFREAPSLPELKQRYNDEMGDYLKWGIHVMVSQNGHGELTIGDSHEYGHTHDPFDKDFINQMILDYLAGFAHFRNDHIVETWHGIYAKLTNGDAFLFSNPQEGVYIFNGLGGAGMTLSFGIAENMVNKFL